MFQGPGNPFLSFAGGLPTLEKLEYMHFSNSDTIGMVQDDENWDPSKRSMESTCAFLAYIWESAIDCHVRYDVQDYSFILCQSAVVIALAWLV